jgi:hypothetical protein
MTPDEATARLAELTAQYAGAPIETPTNAHEAAAKLDRLAADPEWQQKFNAGDVETRREWRELVAMKSGRNSIDDVLAGTANPSPFETVTAGEISTQNLMQAVEWLREDGIPDEGIRHVVESLRPGGKSPFTKQDVAAARAWKHRAMQDRAWVERYLNGAPVERHHMTAVNAILVAGAGDK